MRWHAVDPVRLEREVAAMADMATDLDWNARLSRPEHDDGGGWSGVLPVWPFSRSAPAELDAFLDGERLEVVVLCLQAHPAVKPRVYPIEPQPDPRVRGFNDWHVAPDGSLCLSQRAYDWDGAEFTAELIPKAAGWFLEFLLLSRGHISEMTEVGIVEDDSLDHLITAQNAVTVTEQGYADD